jgi:flagellar biosynthesis protein FlhB
MQKRQRFILVVLAVVIFLSFNVATYWWVSSFGSVITAINRTWQAIVNNWMIVIILTDSLFFLLLIIVWLLDDARRRGWTRSKRWGWIAALLGLGSPALLIYLVLRPKERS